MKTVKVDKDDLLVKLKKNMAIHIEEYDKAVVGYRVYAKEIYEEALDRLDKHDKVTVNFDLHDQPSSHEDEYRRTIAMLEMDIEDIVELSTAEFDQYVLDNWVWKDAFRVSNTKYRM